MSKENQSKINEWKKILDNVDTKLALLDDMVKNIDFKSFCRLKKNFKKKKKSYKIPGKERVKQLGKDVTFAISINILLIENFQNCQKERESFTFIFVQKSNAQMSKIALG